LITGAREFEREEITDVLGPIERTEKNLRLHRAAIFNRHLEPVLML
jgi:hypothetical protein